MDEREIESSEACAVPKWGPKKGLRYEVDDFIVSPPSNEDGGFFHLRYGRRTNPRPSTYDRINKELSMTVEFKDGERRISDLNLGVTSESAVSTPSVNITPTGLTPTETLGSIPQSSSSHSIKPLFVFHLKEPKAKYSENDGCLNSKAEDSSPATDVLNVINPISETPVSENKTTSSEKNIVELSHNEKLRKDNVNKEVLSLSNISLVDKVQSLPVASPVSITPYATPLTTPLTTPCSSPTAKRKVSGVVMEHSNASHSYFCTKPFQNSHNSPDTSPSLAASGMDSGLSSASVQMSKQLESGSKMALTLEPGQGLGKKRRPKPSTLREMNFWAPTSM